MKTGNELSAEELSDILLLIHQTYGYDFTQYSKASIERRMKRFMADMGLHTSFDVRHGLINDKTLFDVFLQKITVNVTEMFRDPDFYRSLRHNVLPVLSSYPIIKIWHAGCATGEEVFSMAILLHEAGLLQRSRIYATDINPANIEKARSGILPLDVMKDYTANYIRSGGTNDFSSYYTAKYDHALISSALRKNIIFSLHNLVTDQVFNEFQLICCRNVMIYFTKDLQDRVSQLFYSSLSPLGYLSLGAKETLYFSTVKKQFETVDRPAKIYRRIH